MDTQHTEYNNLHVVDAYTAEVKVSKCIYSNKSSKLDDMHVLFHALQKDK